ncbi:MAG TPA: hypothetical protein DCZ95_06185, partial [Verrucomicrobia bacterium]|nr:hypothetical protein [Verrucomicrobiota bacterium]
MHTASLKTSIFFVVLICLSFNAKATSVTCHLGPSNSPIDRAKWMLREADNTYHYLTYSYTWYTNGATASFFSTNTIHVMFQSLPFWLAPDDIYPSISPTNEGLEYHVVYTPNYMTNSGVLIDACIEPEKAREDRSSSDDAFDNAGYGFTYKTPGVYIKAFPSILGWITPSNQLVEVVAGQVASYTGVYTAVDVGTRLTVTVQPCPIPNSDRWYLRSQPLSYDYESGRMLTHLTPGNYTIRFGESSNYYLPDIDVAITTNAPVEVVGIYTQRPMRLKVELRTSNGLVTPSEARWAVVGETSTGLIWRTDQSVHPGVSIGSTVTYSQVTGWITPPDYVINQLPESGSLDVIGLYSPSPDAQASLTINILPTNAVRDGAAWGIRFGTNVIWYASGATATDLTSSLYTITFAETSVTGWHKPADRSVTLRENEQGILTIGYEYESGFVSCEIHPVSATADGAQWGVYDYAYGNWRWMTNGATVPTSPGFYTVVYKTINGWATPPQTNFYLGIGASVSLIGQYEPSENSNALQVWLSPSNPVPAGAGWKLDLFSQVYRHGDQLSNLSVGAHSITFCDIPGYITPKRIDFLVAPGESYSFTAVYQQCHRMNIRVALEGPLMTNQLMRCPETVLSQSPYIANPSFVELVNPSNIVDWVLVQLSAGTNSVPYFSSAALLRSDGCVIDRNGLPGIQAQFKGATNWLVIQHRNHLAIMSAAPLDAGAYVHTNDFTQSATAYREGAAAAKQVNGLWCMVAGDTDGDGAITELDRTMMSTLKTSGVCRADMDMTMSVDALDAAYSSNNLGRFSHASCADETILNEQIILSAEHQAVLSLSTTRVDGVLVYDFGGIDKGFVANSSGASAAILSTQIQYVAGAGVGVDRLQVWGRDDSLGRIAFNVISPEMATNAGRAIVLAGTTGLN